MQLILPVLLLSVALMKKSNGFAISQARLTAECRWSQVPSATHEHSIKSRGSLRTMGTSLRSSLLDKAMDTITENTKDTETETAPAKPSVDFWEEKMNVLVDMNKPPMEVEESSGENNQIAELAGVGTLIVALSAFLLINNYVGPWPAAISSVPVEYFGLAHALGGMLFAGGIILTTMIEWLVVASKQPNILKFWFDKVPGLDSLVVLPALATSIVSGVGLAVDHYDSLGESPTHVVAAISTLLGAAVWWAATDLTTQNAADQAVKEWTGGEEVPKIVQLRKISNVVSCMFVVALYAIMVLKPGYSP